MLNLPDKPLCINCNNFNSGWVGGNYVGSPKCIRIIPSLVYGSVPINIDPFRERQSSDGCGEMGRFFQPIPPKASLWKQLYERLIGVA